jgi:hypothetical protein
MSIVSAGFGFLMLIVGRPFYGVFVGAIGFMIGAYLVERYPFLTPANWNPVVMPLIIAVGFVLSTYLAKRWAARVAGFIAGGYILYQLPVVLGAPATWGSPVLFAIAGAVCFILLLVSFDFALMVLSSLLGTTLILQVLHVSTIDPIAMFFILLIFGVITQFLMMQYIRPTPD